MLHSARLNSSVKREGVTFVICFRMLLYPSDRQQFGFRPRRSTLIHLALTTNDWITKFNSGHSRTDAIFIDLKAAYVVNHRLLVGKLPTFGIPDGLCRWFASFLSDRTFQVRLGQALSLPKAAESGVPQGSTVGPCCFSSTLRTLCLRFLNSW